jgi:hypothetical protein
MVKLRWDGYYFHNGLDALEMCFGSTRNALAHDIIQAEKEVASYKHYLDQGGEWIGEVDEEGGTLWDQERVLEMRTESIQDALIILRKSFAISIYHHWERSALEWQGRRKLSIMLLKI